MVQRLAELRDLEPHVAEDARRAARDLNVPDALVPRLVLSRRGEVTAQDIREAVAFVDGYYPGNGNGVIDTDEEREALARLAEDPLSIRLLNAIGAQEQRGALEMKVRDWAGNLRFDVVLGALHAQAAKEKFLTFAKAQTVPEDHIVLAGACVWAFGFGILVNLASILVPFVIVQAEKRLRGKDVTPERIQAHLDRELYDLEPEERDRLREELKSLMRQLFSGADFPEELRSLTSELERFLDLPVDARVKLIESTGEAIVRRVRMAKEHPTELRMLREQVPHLLKRPRVPELNDFYRDLLLDYARRARMPIVGSAENLAQTKRFYCVKSRVPSLLRRNPFKITAQEIADELNKLPTAFYREVRLSAE